MNKSATADLPVVLEAIALSKGFTSLQKNNHPKHELWILHQLQLRVEAGETVAIVGASGSGKSTLLHALGGLEKPQEGKVLWNNQNINQWDNKTLAQQRNKLVGFVYQFHHLLPEFSAQENVAIAMRLGGHNKIEALRAAQQTLQRLGLEHRLEHRPSELSGGERQRVAIARALVTQPKLLLADEPTGNLDDETAALVFHEMLAHVKALNMALVMVTHSMELANQCQRVLHLKHKALHTC